jgi:hypothetical protein
MYGTHYRYPWWGEGLGITISLMSMIWIPLYAVYYLMSEPGTLKQVGTINATDNSTILHLKYVSFDKIKLLFFRSFKEA